MRIIRIKGVCHRIMTNALNLCGLLDQLRAEVEEHRQETYSNAGLHQLGEDASTDAPTADVRPSLPVTNALEV